MRGLPSWVSREKNGDIQSGRAENSDRKNRSKKFRAST
jgi:hypothetical protein